MTFELRDGEWVGARPGREAHRERKAVLVRGLWGKRGGVVFWFLLHFKRGNILNYIIHDTTVINLTKVLKHVYLISPKKICVYLYIQFTHLRLVYFSSIILAFVFNLSQWFLTEPFWSQGPFGKIWKHFQLLQLEGVGGCYWHLVTRGQWCCKHPPNACPRPTRNYPTQSIKCAEVENSCSSAWKEPPPDHRHFNCRGISTGANETALASPPAKSLLGIIWAQRTHKKAGRARGLRTDGIT